MTSLKRKFNENPFENPLLLIPILLLLIGLFFIGIGIYIIAKSGDPEFRKSSFKGEESDMSPASVIAIGCFCILFGLIITMSLFRIM